MFGKSTYSLFTLPTKKGWTLVLNQDVERGPFGNDKAKDVARVKPQRSWIKHRERMAFFFHGATENTTRLDLEWERLRLSVPIEVDAKSMVPGTFRVISRALTTSSGRPLVCR